MPFCYLRFIRFEPAAGRVERSETTEPFTATARRASEASHPARPTSVKRHPKGAFLLSAIYKIRTCNPVRSGSDIRRHPTLLNAIGVTFIRRSAILFSI
ncbi:hypothetical protein C3432_09275 [Citrobacter amalonaticus]|uniref:Uncharacterized protein n=1 Tax=Citrobacter amalonaticus TaxID=35703 RepID=A0A2S4RZN2_CITAM|nr:hypothetical protein C3432_09275 [Citrobacter amalonaticus]POT76373.1 hypothetical protein C3436_02550 [Citrobacter amalonaticus]POU66628.1 hypothetical protein C3430_07475 [Citrobacter amalonaticus]POV05608.1 hypothetical protein C3424_09855 [Citrobacter amalonaticus]